MGPGEPHPLPDPPDAPAPAAAEAVPAAEAVRTLEELAALLRDLRRRHARSRRDSALTYRELAARTGWSQTAIAEYFTARTLPPTDRLDGLLKVLSATPAEQRALATARDRIEEANRRTGRRRTPRAAPAVLPRKPAPGRTEPTPRQLPAAPAMFSGRAGALSFLDAALEPAPESAPDQPSRTGGTLVIGGMSGIGKTWLALHWAHERVDRFPDGQLYVDLRGFDPTGRPQDPATVVRGFLEALGVAPTAIPVGQEAQAALYRSLTAGRRMLLLLDNAHDTAQVVPLLPGGTRCAVLITSRRQLTGLIAAHGAHCVTLDVLPADEARRLLARHLGRGRLGREAGAAAALVTCCAGLPLALGIVAARAATHPDLSLAVLAAELSDDAHRLDALDAGEPQADLRAVLSWSSRALSPDAARALALLAIAPGPDIAPAAAARLLDLPPGPARALLRELDHAHLIQRHAPERYRMHDLLRLHAAEQARDHRDPGERQAALRRVVDFYTYTACAGARALAPHHPAPEPCEPVPGTAEHPPPAPAAATAWFDAEHANLLAAQQAAGDHGWDTRVCHLAWALDPYHRRRGHLEHQATAWQLALAGAQRLPDPAHRARAHQMLGDAYAQLGRTADALRHLGQALDLADRTGDSAGRGEIHHSLGGAWERHGDDRRALEHALHALRIFRTLDDTYRQARALNGVGWLQTRLGEHTEAHANCRAALVLIRGHPSDGRRFGEANILDSLGYIAHCRDEHDQALDHYHQALAICRAQGHRHLEADVLDHIAGTRLAQRQSDRARDAWRQAHELYTAQHRLAAAERVMERLAGLGRPPDG
ncbi:ATP-binding protein [Actinacidiphila acididurans]|uniref:Helix-turn-helix domain-containing protein n=1 Tax=Actinacidiphila acididurans TaxID=2784346 RepID=A0ABS2TVH4_9ACTN|nr:NB-ARC domain-containing protein [Actinacidiphila acididurans]MBM9507348.1 helix-turn-helix domain-containing protein [Actinacidiphila acididurans]